MPNWRRAYVPGGTFFFTLVTDRRAPFLCDEPARAILGGLFRRCQARWPFRVVAIVLLPDHLHTIWAMPPNDANYSRRWGWIKKEFTKAWLAAGGVQQRQTAGRQRDRRRGVWQPKFWEHTLETDEDFEKHCDYIHYNPVKHGLVLRPGDWPWSSFHRWVRQGVYPTNWASGDDARLHRFHSKQMNKTTGE